MENHVGIRVYCAGKIEHNGWRNQLFPIRISADDLDRPHDFAWPEQIEIRSLPGAVYVGPHFLSNDTAATTMGLIVMELLLTAGRAARRIRDLVGRTSSSAA